MTSTVTPVGRAARRAPARRSLDAVAAAACAAGLAWVGVGLESIVRPDPQDYRTVLWVVPFLLTTFAVLGIQRAQRPRGGRVASIGYALHVYGAPVIVFADLMLLGGEGTDGWGALAAALWTAALVLFGIGTARAGFLSKRSGCLIATSELLTIVAGLALSPIVPLHERGGYSGAVMHGVVWLLVAADLRRTAQRRDGRRHALAHGR